MLRKYCKLKVVIFYIFRHLAYLFSEILLLSVESVFVKSPQDGDILRMPPPTTRCI